MSEADGTGSLPAGFAYPTWETTVTPAHQALRLRQSDVEPAIHGDWLDVTLLALESLFATRRAGLSARGTVHVRQAIRLAAPIRLGETLTVRGTVTRVEPASRGTLTWHRFDFVRPDGSVPLTTERAGLRLDPARAAGDARGEPAPARARDDSNGMTRLAAKQLAPGDVAAYIEEAQNPLHDDPEVARRFGYRAPIATGLMGGHFVMEALVRRGGALAGLDMDLRFLRPTFWDDALEVWGRDGPGGTLAEVAIVNTAGKAVSVATLGGVRYLGRAG